MFSAVRGTHSGMCRAGEQSVSGGGPVAVSSTVLTIQQLIRHTLHQEETEIVTNGTHNVELYKYMYVLT